MHTGQPTHLRSHVPQIEQTRGKTRPNRAQLGKYVTCEKLKEMCRQAVLPEHKDKAARAQSERVDVAMQYRRADSLVQRWAEESLMVSNSATRGDRTLLDFDPGWMERAKIRCPPNTTMRKQVVVATPVGSRWSDYGWRWIVFALVVFGSLLRNRRCCTVDCDSTRFSEVLADRSLPMPAHARCVWHCIRRD